MHTLEQHWKVALRSTSEDADFSKKIIIFSDEAHFNLGGYVNKQNCRIWDTENPHAYIEKPTHSKRVTVWCRFWSRGIIRPIFFENKQGEAITVNGDRYRVMLNEYLFTEIEEDWQHLFLNENEIQTALLYGLASEVYFDSFGRNTKEG